MSSCEESAGQRALRLLVDLLKAKKARLENARNYYYALWHPLESDIYRLKQSIEAAQGAIGWLRSATDQTSIRWEDAAKAKAIVEAFEAGKNR